jgi:RNase H
MDAIHKAKPDLELELAWVPGHEGVEGNERADEEAKKAAEGECSHERDLPTFLKKGLKTSISARKGVARKGLRNRWDDQWAKSTRSEKIKRIDEHFDRNSFMKLVRGRNKRAAAVIYQLRSGHAPLNGYLSMMNCAESRACPTCGARSENVLHYLEECHTYDEQRRTMLRDMDPRKRPLAYLLAEEEGIDALLAYVEATGRLKRES